MKELIGRLRDMVQTLRRTPMPIADVIPLLQKSADGLDSLTAERDGYRSWGLQNEASFSAEIERLTAERDALNDTVVRLTADAGIFTLDEQTILASDRNSIRLLALWNQIQADKTGIASYEDRAEYLSGIFPQKRRAKDD